MLGFLRNQPYLVAVLVAFTTAGLAWMYARTIETDPKAVSRTFNKTLAAALVAGLLITWLVQRREKISTEPFTSDG